MQQLRKELLGVKIYEDREKMGFYAAKDISEYISKLLKNKEEINIVFAAAPSQNDVLKSLVADKTIEWNRINAFHMDEYIGLEKGDPRRFGNFLNKYIFGLVPFKSINYIGGINENVEEEIKRYVELLEKNPIDIVIMGIGENGHIAFNDPGVADFHDKEIVKIVALDEICRQQQVNDGCFADIKEVPTHAITLTIPTLIKARHLFCIVPAKSKAKAVYKTIFGDVSETCPASILRLQSNAILYLDNESSELII